MRRSPPAARQLTAIGAQKRPIEELTPEAAEPPEVDATPEFAEVEGEKHKPREESQK
tara:strand:- start:29 stop:199 length:171 start_codon:yes stop_codon:yes gene_type:complete